jgi:phospholipid/cholesterol/gamma-HCH transport system substrate-binding protein
MSTPANYWKLGLFVVVSTLLGLAAVVYFGARTLPRTSVTYTSFFDEAVTGLEVGSPVRYRGVVIGNVAAIAIAPDRRHVAIRYDLTVDVLGRLGLAAPRGTETKLRLPTDLRAQIASTGVTGVKYLQIDFFDERDNPPPALPFAVPDNYIPATPSTLKNLEDSVVRAADRFPEVADHVVAVLGKVERMLDDLEQQQLPARVKGTLDHVDHTLATVDTKLNQVDAQALSAQTQTALGNFNTAVLELHAVLQRLDGERGLLASAQRASDAFGDAAHSAQLVGGDLGETMRDVREMSQAIRDLVQALELDSDMLLKGRAHAEAR